MLLERSATPPVYPPAVLTADDPVQFAQLTPEWPAEYVQLSPGRLSASVQVLNLKHVQLLRETVDKSLLKRGLASCRSPLVFAFPLAAEGIGKAGGRDIPAMAGLLADGSGHPDIVTSGYLDLACLAFDEDWFRQACLLADGEELPEALSRHKTLFIPPEKLAQVRALFETVMGSGHMLPDAARLRAGEDLLLSVLDLFTLSGFQPGPASRPHLQVTDAALELVLEGGLEACSVLELCQKLGVSRRYMQYCFTRVYGKSAVQVLKSVRLGKVREALVAARKEARRETIGDIAARWGFWHWSHFSRDYKAQFGELPSETLGNAGVMS
ncbi:helix-turn-helix domain-containing protein [Pannonibacter sp. Pt2]|uniref:Helix-turn-helix domain-containing protein n=1 Tax=Pannonibacter anstelovis TaxID=3121537 RepID=A0ABU7ZTU0_9HYPH